MPNRLKFVFQTKTLCNAICNNHMSYYAVVQISKYLWYKTQQVHIVWILKLAQYEIQILCNTKFWVTHICPSHRCLMRRGTPLTRSCFMPALNTQQFATVLTHPLTCFSHAEYHYCVTVYQSDVKSELQSVCKLNTYGFYFSPNNTLIKFSYIHRHAIVMQNTTIVWLSIDLMCNVSYKVITTLTLTGFNFFPNSFAFTKYNITDLKIRLFKRI